MVQSLSRVGFQWSWGDGAPSWYHKATELRKEFEGWYPYAMNNELMVVALRWHLPVIL